MTVHIARAHHRPRVRCSGSVKNFPSGPAWFRYRADCTCGFTSPTTSWRGALAFALCHSEALR